MPDWSALLPCVWSFFACAAFCLLFNVRGPGILVCALGAALGHLFFLLSGFLIADDIVQSFVGAVVVSIYAESMARIRKYPVTAYLMIGYFPLLPGGGIYYAMEHAIAGRSDAFLEELLHTLGIAGVLALGILLVSSSVRMYQMFRAKQSARAGI